MSVTTVDVATNIARELNERSWGLERLSAESGVPWGDLVSWRADVAGMTMVELWEIAATAGVKMSSLVQEPQR